MGEVDLERWAMQKFSTGESKTALQGRAEHGAQGEAYERPQLKDLGSFEELTLASKKVVGKDSKGSST